jgi:metallo-beta-lactamase class B
MRKAIYSAVFLGLALSGAVGQSLPGSEGIPQPHLAKARAIAFQGKTWDYPGLMACTIEGGPAEQVLKDPPPTKVFDNLFYVGEGGVSAWAIKTSGGIIIIDALNNAEEAQQYIVGGLQKLGMNPADIKYVVISHGHGDHFGGAKYLKQAYGARIMASREDWDYMAGQKNRTGGAAARWSGLIPDHDMDIADGDKLTLGEETIKLYVTPGHTPGTVSAIIPVTDNGAAHAVGYFGGIASRLLDVKGAAIYDTSITRWLSILKDEKAEGFIANHIAHDGSATKLWHVRNDKGQPNAFLVGLPATMRFYDVLRECNLNNADIHRANAKLGTGISIEQ